MARKWQLWPPKRTKPTQASPVEEGSVNQNTSIPRLHALIIGIDQYASDKIRKLRGAVADAAAIEDFLQESVISPSSQIIKLINREASRDNILKAIQKLARDGRKGDPFLIFYAGHGAEVKNTEMQTIQAILPYDVNVIDDDINNKKAVHPIPDTTLAALIANLADKVGDNITVILDSCYSGSGTRDGDVPRDDDGDPDYPARFVNLKGYCLPDDLDRVVFSNLSSDVLKEASSSSTHVLLAACMSTELAREHSGRGQFTKALIDLLKHTPFQQLTYSEVVPLLGPFRYQHPQCEGDNIHHHFFGGKIRSLRHCYRIQQNDGVFTLNVGELSGIFQGTTFDIYSNRTSAGKRSASIGTMTALSTSPFATTLQVQDPRLIIQLPKGAIALQTKAGILKKPSSKLYVALSGEHADVSSALAKWEKNPHEIRFDTIADRVNAGPALCLEVTCRPSTTASLMINILDPRALDLGLLKTRHAVSATPEKVIALLRAAAHFYYYLDLVPDIKSKSKEPNDEWKDIQSYITVNLTKLQGPKNFRRPVGNNCYDNEMISLVIENSPYGIKLTNKTSHNLYVYVFYFDFTELSILKFYGRRAGWHAHLEPDLRPLTDTPNNTLSIGFGSGGAKAIRFHVPEDQDVDVGYIKFFFSTEPIDLEHVERLGSAFQLVETKGSAFGDDSIPRGASHWDDSESVKAWDIIQVPVRLSKE